MQTLHSESLAKFGDYRERIRASSFRNIIARQFALDVLTEFLKSKAPEQFSCYRCAQILGTTTLRVKVIVDYGVEKGVLKKFLSPDEVTLVSYRDKNELNITNLKWPVKVSTTD